ncbi:MAG TPA: matrixin family metalloprotease [Candidatus Nanoarchaeia archaeon]|nr:matrixin family metalloprotease [Candidatus Nanoarchaeia archaeon]
MKLKLVAVSIFLMVAFSVAVSAKNELSSGDFKIPKGARQISDDVYDLGESLDGGQVVHGYMFVHKNAKSSGSVQKGAARSTCYSFLASGAKWKATEKYAVNSFNLDGMSDSFVKSNVALALDSWDNQVSFKIFGARDDSISVDGADSVSPDGKNEFLFGAISEPGVIAVTTVWGNFGGAPKSRQLVEFDALFDDAEFNWGDATQNSAFMDFLNIAVHELGHAAGMGHPSNSCTEESMYAYASEGETKKRTLNPGDIAGIKALYK